jgi:hypothetical protein
LEESKMLLSDTKEGPVALLKKLIGLYVATLRETPAREWESSYDKQIKTIWGQLLSFTPATLSQANESIKKEIEKTHYSTQFHLTERVATGLLEILNENKSFDHSTHAAKWLDEISLGLSVSARGRATGEREKSVTPVAVAGGGGSAAAVAAPAASLTPFQHAGAPGTAPGTGIEMKPLK